jgi:hypothetical protein
MLKPVKKEQVYPGRGFATQVEFAAVGNVKFVPRLTAPKVVSIERSSFTFHR